MSIPSNLILVYFGHHGNYVHLCELDENGNRKNVTLCGLGKPGQGRTYRAAGATVPNCEKCRAKLAKIQKEIK